MGSLTLRIGQLSGRHCEVWYLAIHPFLFQLVRDLHPGIAARVCTPSGFSDAFYTTSGVLAPAFFCSTIDWLTALLSGCLGIHVGSISASPTDYADDAVLFTDDTSLWDSSV